MCYDGTWDSLTWGDNMTIKQSDKDWIDGAPYETLLYNWRFAPIGHPIFEGETGRYYSKLMKQKREQCGHVRASKNIGWVSNASGVKLDATISSK